MSIEGLRGIKNKNEINEINELNEINKKIGEVREWSNRHDWKSCRYPKGASWVRIPASPPKLVVSSQESGV